MEVHCFGRAVNPLNSEGRKATKKWGVYYGEEIKLYCSESAQGVPARPYGNGKCSWRQGRDLQSDEVKYGSIVFNVAGFACEAC